MTARNTHLTSGKEIFQPSAADPVLVADGNRGKGDRVLVVDGGGDVHRPGEELLGQGHQVLHRERSQEDEYEEVILMPKYTDMFNNNCRPVSTGNIHQN